MSASRRAIIWVNGKFLAGPLYDREGIVYGEINLQRVVEAKLRHDVLGHYSRFDVLSLNFNDEKLVPINYRWGITLSNDDAEGWPAHLQREMHSLERKLDAIGKTAAAGKEE